MTISKLLFVTKFEELSFDALRSLLDLKRSTLNHVIFLNVIEREKVAMQRGTGYRKQEVMRLREMANIRFIDWAEDLFEMGMEVGVYITVGDMVSEAIKAAQKEEADLIVIGRSHKTLLEQLYKGSDVTELIRRASIPVLVYKHLSDVAQVQPKPFERPLLAMDWSPASLKAINYLKPQKNVVQKIDVIYVADEKEITGSSAMEIQKTRKERRGRLDEICAIFQAEGIDAESHVYVGEVEKEIERAARECQSSMIVMGSSAKNVWVERFIGSTPKWIAEKSAFPTLIVPPEPER